MQRYGMGQIILVSQSGRAIAGKARDGLTPPQFTPTQSCLAAWT